MRPSRTHKSLTISALAALALGVAALGSAPATAGAAAQADPVEDRAYSSSGEGLTTCNGGAQKAVLARLSDTPVSTGAAAPVPLAGSQIAFSVPNGENEHVFVTFDAEARLDGQPNTFVDPADFLRMVILLDGVPMPPDNDLMFTTDNGQSNATQACRRVGPGNHVVSVAWHVVDQANASALVGTVDDWAVKVEISD
jgi:hypothetical protein